ncbi:hypothetical protein [Methanobrevibacter sp.]
MKTLIVYYSRTNTTKEIANKLQKELVAILKKSPMVTNTKANLDS